MNPTTEMRVRKIERVSVAVRAVCTAFVILIVIGTIVATIAVVAGHATRVSYYYSQSLPVSDLGLRSRLIVAAVGIATAAVMLKALHHVRRLSCNYSRREIFTAESARQIRQFGISCVLWGLVKIVWACLPLVISTNPPASFGVTLDSVFIGAVVIGISWFAEMAAALREENELTI